MLASGFTESKTFQNQKRTSGSANAIAEQRSVDYEGGPAGEV